MNKVSEKAIWSGLIPSEDIRITPNIKEQSLCPKHLCYNCNTIIPDDSDYCPACGIKLYVSCPKCQLLYSSQYTFCKNCGTNRVEYLEEQERLEEERREAERQAERQLALERKKQAQERKAKADSFRAENEKIMETDEYKTVYNFLVKTRRNYMIALITLGIISFATMVFLNVTYVNNILWVLVWIATYLALYFIIVANSDYIFRLIMIMFSKKCQYPEMCMHIAKKYNPTRWYCDNPLEYFKHLSIKAYRNTMKL